jgi:hypothetical protein
MDERMDALVSDPETWRHHLRLLWLCLSLIMRSARFFGTWEACGCGVAWSGFGRRQTVQRKVCLPLHCQEDQGTCLVPRICDWLISYFKVFKRLPLKYSYISVCLAQMIGPVWSSGPLHYPLGFPCYCSKFHQLIRRTILVGAQQLSTDPCGSHNVQARIRCSSVLMR